MTSGPVDLAPVHVSASYSQGMVLMSPFFTNQCSAIPGPLVPGSVWTRSGPTRNTLGHVLWDPTREEEAWQNKDFAKLA